MTIIYTPCSIKQAYRFVCTPTWQAGVVRKRAELWYAHCSGMGGSIVSAKTRDAAVRLATS